MKLASFRFFTFVSLFIAGTAVAVPGRFAGCPGEVRKAGGAVVAFDVMADEIRAARHVVVGEVHGTPPHARAAGCVLSMLAADDARPVLVMEMLRRSDNGLIEAYRKDHPENAAGLGAALAWWERSWPAFDNWAGLFDMAFALRVPVRGGDIETNRQSPSPALHKAQQARLGKSHGAILASWRQAMKRAHCGMISDAEAGEKAVFQIMRDVSFADASLAAAKNDARVLSYVGRGHARKDRAFMNILTREAPHRQVTAIGLFRAGERVTAEDERLFDWIWVAGAQNEETSVCDLLAPASHEGAGP